MNTNRYFHFLILLIFLSQTLFSPVLLAQTQLPQGKRQTTSARSVDDLFDESVSASERRLLFEFVQYVTNSLPLRAGLRKAADELYKTLERDKFWFSIGIKDTDMAKLLDEANAGRRYLLEKTRPVETRLHGEQRRLEKQLIADHEKIQATGRVPDGFMERVRFLAAFYDSQDALWEMKTALLFKIGTLSNNVVTNYLSHNPKIYSEIKARIKSSNAEMNDMAEFASYHNRQLKALKARFQQAEVLHNQAVIAGLSRDRDKTLDMIEVIRRQAKSLEKQGYANARHHAELLDQVNRGLEYRIDLIDRQLGQLGVTDAFPNPLYIAPGLGTSPESRPLAEAYRGIARKFITQTGLKTNELKGLKADLEKIKRFLGQEQIFFQTLISEAGTITSGEKRDIPKISSGVFTAFKDKLTALANDIDGIISQADNLDFEHPGRIIGSKTDSAKAFRLNREIKKFMSTAAGMKEDSISADIRLYPLLADLGIDRVGKFKSFEMLEKTNLKRTAAIDGFAKKLEYMQALFNDDAALAKNLKELGKNIITQGRDFYKTKISTISNLLEQNKNAAGTPYFEYLAGASEQLKNRLGVIESMIAISKKLKTPSPSVTTPCAGCPMPDSVWPELADLGTAYTDTLQQFDDLADIESFYSPDKISAGSKLADTRLLFDLNAHLGNEPFLHLNPNSIDVVFTAGSRMVVVKGIGDPGAMTFDIASVLGSDYLTQPPFIGGWLSSTISSIGEKWVKPIGRRIADTASSVVSTARAVGGKIATRTGQLARSTLDNAKSAVKTIGEYGSRAWEGAQVWGINTWENAFMNDSESYSWLKVGGYVLGGTACAIAAVGTAGLAAPACAALAVAVSVNAAQGGVDTAKDYGYITKKAADTAKFVLDIVGIVAGGIKGAGGLKKWWGLKGIGPKLSAIVGINPDDLKSIQMLWKKDWSKVPWEKLDFFTDVKNLQGLIKKMGVKPLVDALGSWRNIPDWADKLRGWGLLPKTPAGAPIDPLLINALPGLGPLISGTQLIQDLMDSELPLPGSLPYPYSIAFDPLSPLGTGIPGMPGIPGSDSGTVLPGSGSGVALPGSGGASGNWGGEALPGGGGASGSWGEEALPGGTGAGVTLGPNGEIIETPGPGQQWTVPGQTPSSAGGPYGNWKNPYGNLTNPFRGDNPYRMDNPYR